MISYSSVENNLLYSAACRPVPADDRHGLHAVLCPRGRVPSAAALWRPARFLEPNRQVRRKPVKFIQLFGKPARRTVGYSGNQGVNGGLWNLARFQLPVTSCFLFPKGACLSVRIVTLDVSVAPDMCAIRKNRFGVCATTDRLNSIR